MVSLFKVINAKQSRWYDMVNMQGGFNLLQSTILAGVIVALSDFGRLFAPVISLRTFSFSESGVHAFLAAIFPISFFNLVNASFVHLSAGGARLLDIYSVFHLAYFVAFTAAIMFFRLIDPTLWFNHAFPASVARNFNALSLCAGTLVRTIFSFLSECWQESKAFPTLTAYYGYFFLLAYRLAFPRTILLSFDLTRANKNLFIASEAMFQCFLFLCWHVSSKIKKALRRSSPQLVSKQYGNRQNAIDKHSLFGWNVQPQTLNRIASTGVIIA